MNILITGSTGFIGKHLSRKLIEDGHEIHAVIRNSSDTKFLKKHKIKFFVFDGNIKQLAQYIRENKIIGVIHLASLFLTQHKPEDIRSLIDSNILFGTEVLEAASIAKVSWFINTSSYWQHYKNKDYSPTNLYSATKKAFEDISRYYIESCPINFVTIKLFDTFGPEDTRSKVFNLWDKVANTKEKLDMSKGEQIMDINYIENVIDGYVRLVDLVSKDKQRKLSGKSFVISGERMTLKNLAKLFMATTKNNLNINWGGRPYREREIMIPWTKGKKIPGWKPKISLKEGLRRTFTKK